MADHRMDLPARDLRTILATVHAGRHVEQFGVANISRQSCCSPCGTVRALPLILKVFFSSFSTYSGLSFFISSRSLCENTFLLAPRSMAPNALQSFSSVSFPIFWQDTTKIDVFPCRLLDLMAAPIRFSIDIRSNGANIADNLPFFCPRHRPSF